MGSTLHNFAIQLCAIKCGLDLCVLFRFLDNTCFRPAGRGGGSFDVHRPRIIAEIKRGSGRPSICAVYILCGFWRICFITSAERFCVRVGTGRRLRRLRRRQRRRQRRLRITKTRTHFAFDGLAGILRHINRQFTHGSQIIWPALLPIFRFYCENNCDLCCGLGYSYLYLHVGMWIRFLSRWLSKTYPTVILYAFIHVFLR